MKYTLGMDIGGKSIKLGLFQEDGKLVAKDRVPTVLEIGDNGEQVIPDAVALIEKTLADNNVTKEELTGLGIGVPGPVSEAAIVDGCVNLNWEETFDLAAMMREKTGIENVKIENDATVAAYGEMWQGAAKDCKNFTMITLGTGVGGATILDGELLRGANGVAGEFGHMMVSPDDTLIFPYRGPVQLEEYASADGIVRTAAAILDAQPEIPGTDAFESILDDYDVLSSKAVFDCADQEDRTAEVTVDFTAKVLGTALASIACIINPELIIIGGGVANAGDTLIDPVRKYFKNEAFRSSKSTKIELSELIDDAGIYGAATLCIRP